MSQIGGPSQEVARAVVRFVPDLSDIEQAKRDVERMFEDLASGFKERFGTAVREVFADIRRHTDELKETVASIRPGTDDAPRKVLEAQESHERARPDELLTRLTELSGLIRLIQQTTDNIDQKIPADPRT